jgi:hypothetical protein
MWAPLIAITVIFGCLAWFGWPGYIVIFGIVAAGAWRLWWIQFRGDGLLWVIDHAQFDCEKVRCLYCHGMGVVWLTDGTEIPIPPQNRFAQKGVWTFRPKLANTRRCRYCHGLGHIWRRR